MASSRSSSPLVFVAFVVIVILLHGVDTAESGFFGEARADETSSPVVTTDKKYLRSTLPRTSSTLTLPIVSYPRLLQQSNYAQKTTGTKSVLAVRVKSSKDSLPATTVDEANYAASQVSDFFTKSSGNKLHLSFNVQYAATNSFSCGDSSQVDLIKIYNDLVSKFTGTSYDWFVMLLPNCVKFQFTGLSEIGGNRIWLKGFANGDPLSRDAWASIMAHEMGHLLTANHASFEDNEYGDPYSPMGAGRSLLTGDFEVVAKMMFQWLAPGSQYKWYGAVRHPHCLASPSVCESLSIGETRQTWIYPHDNLPSGGGAGFVPNRVYGVKLTLRESGSYFYLETRGKKPHVVWGEGAHDVELGVLGPPQRIHGRPGRDSVRSVSADRLHRRHLLTHGRG